jgi:CAAX prenyl protease-like protein
LGRLYLLAAVLAVDCALVASVPHAAPLLGPLAPFGIVSFAVFLGLGYRRLKAQREEIRFSAGLFAAHVVCVGALVLVNLAAGHDAGSWLNTRAGLLLAGAVLALAVGLAALACIPMKLWIRIARETSPVWIYATLAGVAAWFLRSPAQGLWIQSSTANVYLLQVVTFRSVQAVLGFVLPDLVVGAGPFVIGTPRFSVSVGAPCSGIEGLALVLVFTIVWLWFFRRENRFPRALALIPCALACAFLLNVVRIAALILIGNAGAPEVAFVGFHSQAGWIAFTLVALAFSMATQRLAWVRKPIALPASQAAVTTNPKVTGNLNPQKTRAGFVSGLDFSRAASAAESAWALAPEGRTSRADATTFPTPIAVHGESPATSAYLIPFLAIMAASFISKSASGYFEWLYPLRFVAAAVALWIFRREYGKLNWRFGWTAPLTGAGIFLVWIAPEWWAHGDAGNTLGSALAALSPVARWGWIAVRVAAAVVTVPIAEELAFRGYLARRLVARDFDEVPFNRLTLVSIALSSLAFGLMHGQHWLVGIVAGLAYAALLRSKGRIGDAVVAHAVSNLLLAIWVSARGDWGMW